MLRILLQWKRTKNNGANSQKNQVHPKVTNNEDFSSPGHTKKGNRSVALAVKNMAPSPVSVNPYLFTLKDHRPNLLLIWMLLLYGY